MSRFEEMLREAFQQPQRDIEEFFEIHFLKPLNTVLDGDEKVPAETIRHQRQQTNKIRNILLTLAKK